ncbi:unnamed protein product [Soboliphyme baturini]|uniref:Zf-Tim10_DDP domain-containing protein n=1 Tax=Soboliphyme baturini TaxID=241478 RepID=A0A183INI1_9BILA|nr:unnamed protein product [Soboliphyme baturini]
MAKLEAIKRKIGGLKARIDNTVRSVEKFLWGSDCRPEVEETLTLMGRCFLKCEEYLGQCETATGIGERKTNDA